MPLYSLLINVFSYSRSVLFYAHPFLSLLFHLTFHQLNLFLA